METLKWTSVHASFLAYELIEIYKGNTTLCHLHEEILDLELLVC